MLSIRVKHLKGIIKKLRSVKTSKWRTQYAHTYQAGCMSERGKSRELLEMQNGGLNTKTEIFFEVGLAIFEFSETNWKSIVQIRFC